MVSLVPPGAPDMHLSPPWTEKLHHTAKTELSPRNDRDLPRRDASTALSPGIEVSAAMVTPCGNYLFPHTGCPYPRCGTAVPINGQIRYRIMELAGIEPAAF
jgi:hypothetical protein